MFRSEPKDPLDLANPAAMEIFDPDATQEVEPYEDIFSAETEEFGIYFEPMLHLPTPDYDLQFHEDGEMIGRFWYDKDAKTWRFEGDADESAKEFAKFMAAHFQSIIEGRDGL